MHLFKSFVILFILLYFQYSNAQVGINTRTPRSTAVLELESEFGNGSFGGFMMPRISSANLALLTVNLTANDEGMLIYDLDNREVKIWNGMLLQWQTLFTFNNSTPLTNSISISGISRVGELLEGNYSFFDADGDPEGMSTFQWYVADDSLGTNQTAIIGATSNTYTIGALEENRFIGLGITPIALRGISPGEEVVFYNTSRIEPEIILWINEIHYNNIDGDLNEGIEIAGLAGVNLENYSIELYNGSNNSVYSTVSLNGIIPNQSNELGTLNFLIPNIQNGDPDGIAFIDNLGRVVQFLSYGGIITANGGAANGLVSMDIGVIETEMIPAGTSLQLQGTGNRFIDFTWNVNIQATRGAVNQGQTFN